MPLQTIEINSVKITFDKDKTKAYRTNYNKPCDCPDCRNYYKHIQNNSELVEFLSGFGIDYNYTEEVFSWDLGNESNSLVHHEGYYGVFGKIEGEDLVFEKFGVKITFAKDVSIPHDRSDECFWIYIEGDFSFILEEERELSITFSEKIKKLSFVEKIKAKFRLFSGGNTMTDPITHYDLLIDENNDPFSEPKIMRDYMNKWDGEAFINALSADKSKTALEIGMGTGRLTSRIAPLFRSVTGIDFSPKTIERAKENLKDLTNISYVLGDFMTYNFSEKFDVIYSSLTLMHIEDKQKAVGKTAALLKDGGRLVLSIDKNKSDVVDYGTRKVKVYPDNPDIIAKYILLSGMKLEEVKETEFAYIIIANKDTVKI